MCEKKGAGQARRIKRQEKPAEMPASGFNHGQTDHLRRLIYGAGYPKEVIATSLASAPVLG